MKIRRFFSRILIIILTVCLISLVYLRKSHPENEPSHTVMHPGGSDFSADPSFPSPDYTPNPSASSELVGEQVEPQMEEPRLPDVDLTDWKLAAVNKNRSLSKSFSTDVSEIEGQYFDSRAVEYLEEFISAVREEGLEAYISTGYRTYASQEYAFNGKASQIHWGGGTYAEAVEKAKESVAFPGTSEHQLGLAVDVLDKSSSNLIADELKNTDTLKWMAENCAKYGFILRYPEGKKDITGFAYEPWHFRYVGEEAAAYILENGLCLEEFLALYD